jgi:hypothetical protein
MMYRRFNTMPTVRSADHTLAGLQPIDAQWIALNGRANRSVSGMQ